MLQAPDEFEKRQRASLKEAERQSRRVSKLKDERKKLLFAHYEEAIPLDLLKTEQERIRREVAEAESVFAATQLRFREIAQTLDQALDLAANCQEAYGRAPDKLRRQFNQVFFRKLLVSDTRVAGAELAEPFAQLLAHDVIKQFHRESKNPGLSFVGQGSKEDQMVVIRVVYNLRRNPGPKVKPPKVPKVLKVKVPKVRPVRSPKPPAPPGFHWVWRD